MARRKVWTRTLLAAGLLAAAAPTAAATAERTAGASPVPASSQRAAHRAPASEPKAFKAVPGPDAEYLLLSDRYTLRDDGAVVHERRSRLQVNSYLAINRRYGESKVEYDPEIETFEVLEDRTVLPSGTVVEAPANAIVDDQLPAAENDPLWSGLRRKIVVHTALEPGAVIEEAWRVTTRPGVLPWLEIKEPLHAEVPVRVREITADAPTGAELRWQNSGPISARPEIVRAQGRQKWSWTLHDTPAAPDEPGAPSRELTLPTLWASTCPSLEALAQEVNQLLLHGGPAGSEGLVALARRVDAREASEETRVLAVLQAVSEAVAVANLAPPAQHWQPRDPDRIWRTGVATPLELAALEATALHAVGFKAQPGLVTAQGRRLDLAPGLVGLDRAVVVVGWGADGLRLFDPVEPAKGGPLEALADDRQLVPPGQIGHPERRLVFGRGSRAARLVLTVAADGKLTGSLSADFAGAVVPHGAVVQGAKKLADELAAGLVPGGKAISVTVVELRRNLAKLVVQVEGKLPAADAFGLVRLAFGGVPGGVERELPPLPAAERLAPIAMPGVEFEEIRVELELPRGATVAAEPVGAQIENSVGRVRVRFEPLRDGRVELWREIRVNSPLVYPEGAAAVRAIVAAWLSPASRELLLRLPAAAPGNASPPSSPAATR